MLRRQPPSRIQWTVVFAIAITSLATSVCLAQSSDNLSPTFKNVSYGPHERNVLDYWRAKSDQPTPLVVYIHGGGFHSGSKNGIKASETLKSLLNAKISVAALNYRYVNQEPLPAAHYDCRRALQFLRSRAKVWGLDNTRVGAFGHSAGAQICMYLAFHDEMAKPDSDDPIERESTRLTCVATRGGQTTRDVGWWKKHIPDYKTPHQDFFDKFGVKTQEEYQKKVAEVSALSLITKDDPPIFMYYGMKPDDPDPPTPMQQVHHVVFGVELKKRMDKHGIEAVLSYPGATNRYQSKTEFFIAKFSKPTTQD